MRSHHLIALFLSCLLSCVVAQQNIEKIALRDLPIATDLPASTLYLDGTWQLTSSAQHKITGDVPGDIITDLQNAKLINDPNYETNWLDHSSLWSANDWTYSISFKYEVDTSAKEVLLVFDGIKMGANIILNGRTIGQARDQFLRYHYAVGSLLEADNVLQVVFPKGNAIDVEGRFMACSGGWDWAPYSNTKDQHGATTMSYGIWKSVYLVSVKSVAITNVVPSVLYTGPYPTESLESGAQKFPWSVNAKVFFYTPHVVTGTIGLTTTGGSTSTFSATKIVDVQANETSHEIDLSVTNVKLWWPIGYGTPSVADLHITFNVTGNNPVSAMRTIGFRTFALVTDDDSNPETLKGKDGSGTLTMRFRVNGVNIWSRGGNMIPVDEYEGRVIGSAVTQLVKSAAVANYNLLRIWGGGIYLYELFYQQCDALGIMLYHDMMYAQGGHSPAVTPTQEAELRHQVRRLSHHASIVIWDGCNECGGSGLYTSFVVTTVAQEDQSRAVWPSCPSNGYDSGVDRLYGRPNNKTLVWRSTNTGFEEHGPYQHGNGWKMVNGDPNLSLFNPNMPPGLHTNTKTGITLKGQFTSEFGCSVMSSFESMAPTLSQAHWSMHAPPMYQRNYPCDNIIAVYWGRLNLNLTGELPFREQIYKCMIGQALEMKSDIEVRRSGNTFGTVVWQLGEIWPTDGWGSVEYAVPVEGQVVGGRWKPLQYFLANQLFKNVISTCGPDGMCYVKNDGADVFKGQVTITALHLVTGKTTQVSQNMFGLIGSSQIDWFCMKAQDPTHCMPLAQVLTSSGCFANGTDCIFTIDITGNVPSPQRNVFPVVVPSRMTLPKTNVQVAAASNTKGGATITISTDNAALYVWISTLAQGTFSDNGILAMPGKTEIEFNPIGELNLSLLQSSLKVEHAAKYVAK